ncbi:hypothetical protein AZI85_02900 [Bdellovibrio bacteriovorus]|uniref:Lipoprotein n=1 Tax=Bdellovibrio bacteriovorus TaxID=959 RepID=A0A150WKS6_BDEBC|nr:hypothetical protein [Bdellovibrio bacteriovorus]KYG64387.1 hypothetical protein AZI85_02900 [Bdellovibrio bacteriovorus]
MRKLLLVCAVFAVAACSSKHKAKDIDTTVDMSAPVRSDSVVGVKDGDMVYQRKVVMSEELRRLELDVYDLEAKVLGGPRYLDNRGLYGVLRDCRVSLGSVENSGDGKVRWTESRQYVTPDDDFSSIGVEDKKRIVGVSEEYLKDRLARFKDYKNTLEKRQDEYETKVKVCELELAAQKKKGKASAANNE